MEPCQSYIIVCMLVTIATIVIAVTQPPSIVNQPQKLKFFKGDDTERKLEVPCIAAGEPPAKYRWTKDDKDLDLDAPEYQHIAQASGIGTLIINKPSEVDEGFYQCFASNSFGTSVSIRSQLQKAILGSFISPDSIEKHEPMVGYSLKLECGAPSGIPEPSMSWVRTIKNQDYSGSKDDDWTVIRQSERITQDFKGNLYITNVMMNDSTTEGTVYLCTAKNSALKSMVQGKDHEIIPRMPDSVAPVPVEKMWTSLKHVLGLRGSTLRIKCIFSGNPTPHVSWERKENKELPDRAEMGNNGQELFIVNLDFMDAGVYACHGVNNISKQSEEFHVKVESAPFWVDEPQDVEAGVDEEAKFLCNAGGEPRPEIEWFINGVPIAQVPKQDNEVRYRGNMRYSKLDKSDARVIQCSAKNEHGSLWADVFLNVLSEEPKIEVEPEANQKVAEDQMINITCKTSGKPKPTVIWYKGDVELDGTHFKILKDGSLRIKKAVLEDSGTYHCRAQNRFGKASASGNVTVRVKTEIVGEPPDGEEQIAGDDVTLTCKAVTDPLENDNLEVKWLFENKPIESYDGHHIIDRESLALTILRTKSKDTGRYTCNITNGIDYDIASFRMIVKDKPGSPEELEMPGCGQQRARLKWKSGQEHNSPIIKYIVQYNTAFEPNQWKLGKTVKAPKLSADVKMSPWTNYTFRVIAVNDVGQSAPSDPSSICVTDPDRPEMHPDNVHTVNNKKDHIVINWDEMPPIDHNGPDFQYVVKVWSKDDPPKLIYNGTIDDYKKTSLSIEVNTTYQPYDIKVQARNSLGVCLAEVTGINGHSGEDEPLLTPTDFRLDTSKEITPSSAAFIWTKVIYKSNLMRGEFQGYRIQFWKSEDRENTFQEVDVERSSYGHSNRRKRANDPKEEYHTVNSFPPFSNLTVQVVVANTYYVGPPSDQVFLETPEGVPDSVTFLSARVRGANHFVLFWGEPAAINGKLLGYDIGYQKITYSNPDIVDSMTTITKHVVGQMQYLDQPGDEPLQQVALLDGLEDDQYYRLHIWAKTREGRGKEYYIDVRTAEAGPPDEPIVTIQNISTNDFNVTWHATGEMGGRMGFYYHVQYRKLGDKDWQVTPKLTTQLWQNVSSLYSGTDYEVRVIATKDTHTTESEIQHATTGPEAAAVQGITTAGWFIGMMITIALLILILIIVCIIKRNRGDKYHVQEKERLRGRDPENGDNEDFNGYTKNGDDDSMAKRSPGGGSLAELNKPGSESDSMEEYAGVDPSKFNEDGSFIGQYGTKTQTDANAPPSMSTFV